MTRQGPFHGLSTEDLYTALKVVSQAYPSRATTIVVRPEDAPQLSFLAGQQSVIVAIATELKQRDKENGNGGIG